MKTCLLVCSLALSAWGQTVLSDDCTDTRPNQVVTCKQGRIIQPRQVGDRWDDEVFDGKQWRKFRELVDVPAIQHPGVEWQPVWTCADKSKGVFLLQDMVGNWHCVKF